MALGRLLKDRQLSSGNLPINLLERSPLSPMARLCWAVLDSCGADLIFPSLATIAFRMGLNPENRKSIIRWLDELEKYGFLEKHAKFGESTEYFLTMPDYCWVHQWSKFLTEIHKAHSETPKPTGKRRSAPKVSFDRLAWLNAVEGRREARVKGRKMLKKEKAATSGPRATPPTGGTSGPRATPPVAHGPHPLWPTGHTTVESTVESTGRVKNQKAKGCPLPEWADIFEAVTTKTWFWNSDSERHGKEIKRRVPNIATRKIMLLKYARDDYWADKGCPLDKFLNNLSKYSLDRLEKMSVCVHGDYETREYDSLAGRQEEKKCRACMRKWTVLISKAPDTPHTDEYTAPHPEVAEKYRKAQEGGATADELSDILMHQFK